MTLVKGFLEKQIFLIMPSVIKWAEDGERYIIKEGRCLNSDELGDAKHAGVRRPEKIRICLVRDFPRPVNGLLGKANKIVNFVTDTTLGLTLNYGIFIRRDYSNDRFLYFHEYVHVSQYERFDGFKGFLNQYINECLAHGYLNSDLENEAVKKTEEFKIQKLRS